MNSFTQKKSSVLLFLCLTINAMAQTPPDGTQAKPTTINLLLNNLTDEQDFWQTTANAKMNLSFFVVDRMDGEPGMGQNIIEGVVNNTNSFFDEMNLEFIIADITPVHNLKYNLIDTLEKAETLAKHHKSNLNINIYLVNEINLKGTGYYGFTYFPNDADMNNLYLAKPYFHEANLAQQLGHFLGLLNTHETINGRENVERYNCDELGDLLCDTYADPNINMAVSQETCLYSGTEKDSKGEYYQPTVANIMSSAPENCRCIFTKGQQNRMIFYLKKYRYNLLH